MIDWFALAQELSDPRPVFEYIDPQYVESNDTFPVLDEDFDQ